MELKEFLNQDKIIDLSFFNFSNAVTAAYFANKNLEVIKVNDNFKKFFPVLKNVNNILFPSILDALFTVDCTKTSASMENVKLKLDR